MCTCVCVCVRTCVCAGGAGVPKAPQPGEVLGDQVAVNVGTVALHPRKSTATGTYHVMTVMAVSVWSEMMHTYIVSYTHPCVYVPPSLPPPLSLFLLSCICLRDISVSGWYFVFPSVVAGLC